MSNVKSVQVLPRIDDVSLIKVKFNSSSMKVSNDSSCIKFTFKSEMSMIGVERSGSGMKLTVPFEKTIKDRNGTI